MQLKRSLNYSSVQYPDIFELEYQASGIILPAAAAQYISTMGEVILPNGPNVVPHIPTPQELQWYFTPRAFWMEAHPNQQPPDNYWCLDNNWITDWINHVSKGGKIDLGLRRIDNTVTDGHGMMVVSSLAVPGKTAVSPVTPLKMAKVEAEVGAAFDFRSYREYSEWPGSNAELLFATESAPPIYPRKVINDLCVRTTRAEGKSMGGN